MQDSSLEYSPVLVLEAWSMQLPAHTLLFCIQIAFFLSVSDILPFLFTLTYKRENNVFGSWSCFTAFIWAFLPQSLLSTSRHPKDQINEHNILGPVPVPWKCYFPGATVPDYCSLPRHSRLLRPMGKTSVKFRRKSLWRRHFISLITQLCCYHKHLRLTES